MNPVKVSANSQIIQGQGGDVVGNVSAQALRKAQIAFVDAAEAMGIADEADAQALVDEARYGEKRQRADIS